MTGVQHAAGAIMFSFLHHSVKTGSEAHPASYPVGTRGSYLDRGMKPTTYMQLVLSLRMRRVIPSLPQYVFKA